MEVKKVLTELDIGMSNITIEGEVTYTEVPEHRISPPDAKKEYDFWSQFIVIDDGTGKIGCSISVNDEDDGMVKGVMARVKGKLKEWQGKRKIQGKLIAISKGDKVTDVQQERAEQYFENKAKEGKKEEVKVVNVNKGNNNGYQAKEKYWQNKHEWEKHTWRFNRAGMSRSNGVNYAKDMIDILLKHKIIKPKENEVMTYFWGLVGEFGRYIFNGERPDNGNGKKKSILRDNHEPLEKISDEPLFPAEEIENAVNEIEKAEEKDGSSPDKARPFKGKRKSLEGVPD